MFFFRSKKYLFNQAFSYKGGAYDYSKSKQSKIFKQVENEIHASLNYLKEDYQFLPNITFGFVNDPSLNATALKIDNKYFIGINYGSILILIDMFTIMLSCKNVLIDVGDIKNETEGKRIISAYLENSSNSMIVWDDNGFIEFPKDPKRLALANCFISASIQYLFFHECCHIIRGHLGLISQNNKKCEWVEIGYNDLKVIDQAINKTLEMDADSFATNRTLMILNNILNKEIIFENSEILFESQEKAIGYWSFCIYSFFRLINIERTEMDEISEKYYPPPNFRIAMVLGNMNSIHIKLNYSKRMIDLFSKVALNYSEFAEKAFLEVTFQDDKLISIYSVFSPKGRKIMASIYKNWNNVRPILEPYAFGQLPPENRD